MRSRGLHPPQNLCQGIAAQKLVLELDESGGPRKFPGRNGAYRGSASVREEIQYARTNEKFNEWKFCGDLATFSGMEENLLLIILLHIFFRNYVLHVGGVGVTARHFRSPLIRRLQENADSATDYDFNKMSGQCCSEVAEIHARSCVTPQDPLQGPSRCTYALVNVRKHNSVVYRKAGTAVS